MEIQLPPDQQTLIENLVASGRFQSVDEAVAEGVRLLVSTEKLREDVQLAINQADRGEVLDHDTVFARLRATAASGDSSR